VLKGLCALSSGIAQSKSKSSFLAFFFLPDLPFLSGDDFVDLASLSFPLPFLSAAVSSCDSIVFLCSSTSSF